MTGFTDIHAHLIPGIDDGPEDLATAIEMARAAAASGTSTIVATPHLRSDFPNVHVAEIADRCQAVQEAIDEAGISLRVMPGAEVSLVWALEAKDEDLRLASLGQRGTDLLIETPNDVSMITQLLFQLRIRRYRITLAHPERSREFQRFPDRVEALAENGVLLQVNAETLLLPRRSGRRRLAERLCRDGHAHVLASDGHLADGPRPVTELADGVEAAAAILGEERAQWMAAAAPHAIAEGEQLPDPPPIARRRRVRRPAPPQATTPRTEVSAAPTNLPAKPSLGTRLSRAMILVPLAAVAVVSFALVRSQQGSGATVAQQQRNSPSLNRVAVDRVLRAAPNPTTHQKALRASCDARGHGALRNPWQCTMTYPGGQRIGWRVQIFPNGSYIGLNQTIYRGSLPPERSRGTITGCCIAIP